MFFPGDGEKSDIGPLVTNNSIVFLPFRLVMNPQVNELTRVFYHGDGCPDGKCASWIIWRLFRAQYQSKKIPIVGVVHGHLPPAVDGDVVAILDFCFPRSVIINMAKQAKHIYILDHHTSTSRELFPPHTAGKPNPALPSNVTAIIDETRSGSEITWDWVYPGIPRPWFVEVISDRDLFRWTRPYSNLVCNALFSNGYYKWEKLEWLFDESTDTEAINRLIKDFCIMGSALPDPARLIDSACAGAFLAEMTTPNGEVYRVKLVQCPKLYRSEVGNKLSRTGCDFAVLYQYDFMLDEWWVSCRASDDCEIDLSELSQQFDRGGGHRKSAGFTIFGSKGDKLQTYFKILTAPPSRSKDLDLLKGMGGAKKTFNHVKITDLTKG